MYTYFFYFVNNSMYKKKTLMQNSYWYFRKVHSGFEILYALNSLNIACLLYVPGAIDLLKCILYDYNSFALCRVYKYVCYLLQNNWNIGSFHLLQDNFRFLHFICAYMFPVEFNLCFTWII